MSRLQVFILAELNVAQAFKKVRGITVKELAYRIPIKSPVDTVYRNIKTLIDEGFIKKVLKWENLIVITLLKLVLLH